MTNFFDFAISGLPDASAVGRRLPPSEIDRLLQTGAFAAALRLLAGSFIALYEGSPDITALFATRCWRSIFKSARPERTNPP